MRAFCLLLILLSGASGQCKTFKNNYVSFDVPEDWNCSPEGGAWTCTAQNPVAAKEAIIILAVKIAGPEDTLNSFLTFLKAPKKISTKVGTPMPSSVMYAQDRMLGGQNWVQAQHLGSEIQDYYTLYLATVKNQLAILVSFSAEKDHYANYNPIFDRAVRSLTILANNQLVIAKSKNPALGANESLGIRPMLDQVHPEFMPPPEKKSLNKKFVFFALGIGVLLILAGIFFVKSRRKKNSRGKSPKLRSK